MNYDFTGKNHVLNRFLNDHWSYLKSYKLFIHKFFYVLIIFLSGELRDTRDFSGGNVLPPRQDASEQDPIDLTPCNMLTPQFPCFHSGDGQRVNQHPGINAIQTVTLRRHNQHAYSLSQVWIIINWKLYIQK